MFTTGEKETMWLIFLVLKKCIATLSHDDLPEQI